MVFASVVLINGTRFAQQRSHIGGTHARRELGELRWLHGVGIHTPDQGRHGRQRQEKQHPGNRQHKSPDPSFCGNRYLHVLVRYKINLLKSSSCVTSSSRSLT